MSAQIVITFPDGRQQEFTQGITALEIAQSISEGLTRNVLAASVNGEVWDATRPIITDAKLKLFTWNDQEGKSTMWHSSAHLLAEALEEIYPGVKFGIGPSVENGFYYDIDLGDHYISDADLNKIEQKMKELSNRKVSYTRKDVSKTDALAFFEEKGDEYKLELIRELNDGEITFYEQGNV